MFVYLLPQCLLFRHINKIHSKKQLKTVTFCNLSTPLAMSQLADNVGLGEKLLTLQSCTAVQVFPMENVRSG